MADRTVRIEGLEEVRKLMGVNFAPMMQTITLGVGELVRKGIAKYPGPVVHRIEWASEKQRRWYFAMRREAGLSPGYTRLSDSMSQRLRDSWITDQLGLMSAVVTSRSTYAYWVQSAEGQQPMHRNTGWITDQEVVDAVTDSGDIDRVVEKVLSSWLGA